MGLRLVPVTLAQANAFVREHHRHAPPTLGHRWSVGCEVGDKLIGVVIVGRPVARASDDGRTAEVLRLATTGEKNACSFLYSAAARAARAMGYRRIQTYTLEDEPGTSLRAAGWTEDGMTTGGQWADHRPDARQLQLDGHVRRIREGASSGPKRRWMKVLV